MAGSRFVATALLGCGLAFLSLPDAAAAQCQLCGPSQTAAAKKPVLRPITVSVETTMDFATIGLIRLNQGGTAQIDPATGQRILTGNLNGLGGFPVVGTVLITAEPGSHVDVTFPASVELFNKSGASYRLSNFRTTLKNNPKVESDGMLRFTFGALLQITGVSTGTFRGAIPITVDYK